MDERIHSLLVIGGLLFALLTLSANLIWVERRLLALWQDRYGPNRVGPFGLLQVIADAIKMLTKEDWTPPFADRPVFVIAPAIQVTDMNVGLLFILGLSSLRYLGVEVHGATRLFGDNGSVVTS
jgi:NADH-quinone oxidoreductase subunit H